LAFAVNGWTSIKRSADTENVRFRKATADPVTAQRTLLNVILSENAGTEFGVAHRYSKISSVRDFQNEVPVTTYSTIKAHIERALAGVPNVLTAAPVIACEETGGTSGGAKLVPYTKNSISAFRSAILPSLADLILRRPNVSAGEIYAAISPAVRKPKQTSGGVPIGLAGDGAYLGEELVEHFVNILAVSPDVSLIEDVDLWRASTLDQLSACHSLSFVSVWSPTFWLELTRDLDHQELWHSLDTISCWTDGPSALFARQLQHRFPRVHIEPKGLLSTESPITLAYGEAEGCVPALTSAFLEFVDTAENVHLVHELSENSQYRVIATTPGGLYRYDTQDIVRCVSIHQGLPRLVFVGRAGNVSDLVGEKLDEAFVAFALNSLPVAARLVARSEPMPHYELWLDETHPNASQIIDAELSRNPQYDYARKMGQLGDIALVVRPEFWEGFSSGKRLGVIKPSVLERLQVVQS
jgi:hypothetical protein